MHEAPLVDCCMSVAHHGFNDLCVCHSSLSGVKGELLPSRTSSLLLESSFDSLFIIAIIVSNAKRSVMVSQKRHIKVLRYCPT